MISETRQGYVEEAKKLGDYQSMSVNYLMDNYCAYMDAGDSAMSSRYLAAIMLRFWSKIGKMYMKQSANWGLDMEDFHDWLYDAIEYACKYRAWQDVNKHVNAEQAINKCIETTVLQHAYQYRLDKHKVNYNGNYSLDQPINADGEEEVRLGDLIESETNDIDTLVSNRAVEEIIQRYINKKKIVEAIILSCIAYNNCEREIKEISYFVNEDDKKEKQVKKYIKFWPYKLVQNLSKLPETYGTTFQKAFSVSEPEFNAAMNAIKTAPNQKLYKYVRATLEGAKKDFTY